MATYNNWMTHNLRERFNNKNEPFVVNLHPYQFASMNFSEASDYTANLIHQKYSKIFLSFSGGLDSDYVFHVFKRNNIPFEPIIVKTSGNALEMKYALHTCKKFNVTPIILTLDDLEYLSFLDSQVIEKISGHGLCAIPGIFACEYAKANSGICVIGEHMIDNDDESIFPGMNEWDFYNETFVGEEYNVPFFNYTVELTNAMIESIDSNTIDEWKHKLYNLTYRPIIDYHFDVKFQMIKYGLFKKQKQKPINHFNPGSKESLLTLFNNFKFDK